MLFQPTNIVPSSFSGVGGALIDAADGMTVSWQVNGTSPMTGYRIDIYRNDTASTQLYTTGIVTLAEPFYGTDGMGNPQTYGIFIDAAVLSANGIVNGYESGYKYKIRQYWSGADYIDQSAENYFICQAAPTVSIDTSAITTPGTAITGSWSQEDGVGMDWVRWTVTLYTDAVGDAETLLLDSGKIHTQVLRYAYDGWISGTSYTVTLEYQLQNGYTGTVKRVLAASWTETAARAKATARLMAGCGDVLLTYPMPTYGTLTGGGTGVETEETGIRLTSGAGTLTWAGQALTGQLTYGGIAWSGMPLGDVTVTLRATYATENGVYRDGTFTIVIGGDGIVTWKTDGNAETGTMDLGQAVLGKNVALIAGKDEWSVTVSRTAALFVNGTRLIPGYTCSVNGSGITDDLHVGVSGESYLLGGTISTETYTFDAPQTGSFVLDAGNAVITLGGAQRCYYIGVTNGETFGEAAQTIAADPASQPEYDGQWLFLTDFTEDGISPIGSITELTGTNVQVSSILIYRQESGAALLEKLYAVSSSSDMSMGDIGRVIDCGVKNGTGYAYSVRYLFTATGTAAYAATMNSGSITPCGWDWTITTAAPDGNGVYHMTGEYRFGLNVSTDAMSNNNAPVLMQNFTRYPTRQGVSANYRSGSLTAYIGAVDRENSIYTDTAAQAEAIMALGASADAKFLRSRKGELWMVDTSGATTVNVGDKYREQPYAATLAWAETGDAAGKAVLSVPTDAAWPL